MTTTSLWRNIGSVDVFGRVLGGCLEVLKVIFFFFSGGELCGGEGGSQEALGRSFGEKNMFQKQTNQKHIEISLEHINISKNIKPLLYPLKNNQNRLKTTFFLKGSWRPALSQYPNCMGQELSEMSLRPPRQKLEIAKLPVNHPART